MNTASYKRPELMRTAGSLLVFTRKEKRYLRFLLSVVKAIESIFHLEEMLEKIMDYAIQVTGSERGFLFLYSEQAGDLTLKVMRGVSEELRKSPYSHETYKVSSQIIHEVEMTGKALIGGLAGDSLHKGCSGLEQDGIRHVMCVPLQTREKAWGLLYFDCCAGGEIYGEKELDLMRSFAVLVSISIENDYLKRTQEKHEQSNVMVTIESNPSAPHLKIISIRGIMDSGSSEYVDGNVLPIIEFETSDIILDLSNLHSISRMGMLCFVTYLRLMTDKKRSIKFVRPSRHVHETMALRGFAKRMEIYDSIEAAIHSPR